MQQDGQSGTEGGAGGSAQNIRGCHGILEHTLVGSACTGQTSAYHASQQNPGQTVLQKQRFLGFCPERFHFQNLRSQNAAQFLKPDGIPSQGHGTDHGGK